jgi:hypothetical protein
MTPAQHPRHRALDELAIKIGEAERARDWHRNEIERIRAAGLSDRRARAMLRLAETRLAQFYRSREVLLSGEEGPILMSLP